MTPVVTNTSQPLVFAVSLVIGGLLGVTFVLVRTAFRSRNAAINEASS
jgi:LPS O-antigen subunit length determinant protein (WzzB/FepE family)